MAQPHNRLQAAGKNKDHNSYCFRETTCQACEHLLGTCFTSNHTLRDRGHEVPITDDQPEAREAATIPDSYLLFEKALRGGFQKGCGKWLRAVFPR